MSMGNLLGSSPYTRRKYAAHIGCASSSSAELKTGSQLFPLPAATHSEQPLQRSCSHFSLQGVRVL
eukprot:scaffold16814_cov69-Phaeocystis_antarctica.AAC.6